MKKFKNNIIDLKFITKIFETQDGGFLPKPTLIVIFLILGAVTALIQFRGKSDGKEKPSVPLSIDTFIPEGESLVPIQVSNYESLDQVIGQYGVVDLLTTPLSPDEKSKRVAYAIKLVRSPKSPRHFSALVPAEKAPQLAGHNGEFMVVVRNPKLVGTKFVKEVGSKPKRQIFYESEKL